MADKVIINCAITGAIHTPTMSPYLPIQPEDIARQAIDAAKAGATTVHIHIRDPKDGRPSTDVSLFGTIIDMIKAESDVIICTTTGGGLGMTVEERVAVVPKYKPELASCNMGSINFALFPILNKLKEFKYDWEEGYLSMTKDFIFRNTFQDLEKVTTIMKENGTKPELEIYDVGHLNNAAFLLNAGLVEPAAVPPVRHGHPGRVFRPASRTWSFSRSRPTGSWARATTSTPPSARARWNTPSAPPRCSWAATAGWGWRTTSIWARGVMAKSNAEMVEKNAPHHRGVLPGRGHARRRPGDPGAQIERP